MASNPTPFQVEDNTDEDFFDKLVTDDDDDLEFKVGDIPAALAGHGFSGGNELNEANALAKLSINEVKNNSKVDDKTAARSGNLTFIHESHEDNGEVEKVGSVVESRSPLVPPDSFEFDTLGLVQKPKNEIGGSGDLSDTSVLSKSSSKDSSDTVIVRNVSGESGSSGVKELEWSAFHADSAKNNSNGFGPHSDFLSEGEKAGDAFGNVGVSLHNESTFASSTEEHGYTHELNSNDLRQYQEQYDFGTAAEQDPARHDLNSIQYWENLYTGWKYDLSSGQWYQVDGYDAGASMQENVNSNYSSILEGNANISYLQKTAPSIVATVRDASMTGSVTGWNQGSQVNDDAASTTDWNQGSHLSSDKIGVTKNQDSQVNGGYPPHMIFDPQYPGWYYDTISQEWCSLKSCTPVLSNAQTQVNQNGCVSPDTFGQSNDHKVYDQVNNWGFQSYNNQGQDQNSAGSYSNYNQQRSRMWKPEIVAKNEPASQYRGN